MVLDGHAAGLREKWKGDVAVMYDWFMNHHLMWPSLSCRWGAVVADHPTYVEQRLYLSEQTDGNTMPNSLIISNVSVPKARMTPAEYLSDEWDDDEASNLVALIKTINHPGEVNRIRELPQHPHIIATHTDGPDVFVWNTESQANRERLENATKQSAYPSVPDLILTGHEADAPFALATCPAGPFVLSGGHDHHVAMWCLEDKVSTSTPSAAGFESPTIGARTLFRGHRDNVEDVQFKPDSPHQFASVGDDHCLLLWDSRAGDTPVIAAERAHRRDIHCVDWSGYDGNLLLTGSADCSVRVFDRRRLQAKGYGTPLYALNAHSDAVNSVQWSGHTRGYFVSAGDDGLVNVFDLSRLEEAGGGKGGKDSVFSPGIRGAQSPMSAQLGRHDGSVVFQHIGHRDKVTDVHWNPCDPWSVVTTSTDSGRIGGGTLQVWRMNELLHMSDEEATAELNAWQALTES